MIPWSDKHLISPHYLIPESHMTGQKNKRNYHLLKKLQIINPLTPMSDQDRILPFHNFNQISGDN